jgi:hypothetical protein
MDDVLVARNVHGHLTAPMLFLDREAVPKDAEDWEQVLVFVDGKTRATIDSTIIILHEGNDYTQSLTVETGGAWSISGVDEGRVLIDHDQMSGVGKATIDIRKPLPFDEPGFHPSAFTLSIDGAVVTEMNIQVYIFIGNGLGPIRQKHIILNEDNVYSALLDIPVVPGRQAVGVNEDYVCVAENPAGGFVITIPDPNAPWNYVGSFVIVSFEPAEVTIVSVEVVATVPLHVTWHNGSQWLEARHGETLTVNIKAPGYAQQSLYIYRDQAWSLEGIETDKITVEPTAYSGGGYVQISKPENLTVTEKVTTTFRIVSLNQYVDIIVNILPSITGEWSNPRPGEEGVTGTQDVYIYL